jgi:tripartite-type tricarboxylate transporter receptor subunit TctC
MKSSILRRGLFGALLTLGVANAARAESVEDFYRGKTVELYVGFSAGGGYDVYARLLSRYMGRHIPGNPAMVVKTMEGAGSVRLANYMYAVAPKDGTVIGTFARGVPLDPLFGNPGPQFKDASSFTYIGSANAEVSVCGVNPASGVRRFSDLFEKDLVVGGFGAGTESEQHVKLSNAVLGTRFKLVRGYPGGNDVSLALARGEVQARCGWSWTSIRGGEQMAQVKDGSLVIIVQNSMEKHPDIPDVPLITDFVKSDEQRQMLSLVLAPQKMGRPFFGTPGIPADRLTALQKAFTETMSDPQFLAEADKMQLEISPITGAEMQSIIQSAYATAPDLVKKTAEAIR